MPKSKWSDAEEPAINHFIIYKIGTDNFEYALLSANRLKSIAVSNINRS